MAFEPAAEPAADGRLVVTPAGTRTDGLEQAGVGVLAERTGALVGWRPLGAEPAPATFDRLVPGPYAVVFAPSRQHARYGYLRRVGIEVASGDNAVELPLATAAVELVVDAAGAERLFPGVIAVLERPDDPSWRAPSDGAPRSTAEFRIGPLGHGRYRASLIGPLRADRPVEFDVPAAAPVVVPLTPR